MRRPTNEDNCYADTTKIQGDDIGIFVVADGMGGHNKGEVASKLAVDELKNYLKAYLDENNGQEIDLKMLLSRAFYETNKAVFDQATENEKFSGMGTTLIAAIINSNNLVLGNVGDSRAYVFREGILHQLTKDNSYVQELIEKGIINPEDAKLHPQKNVITRAIGTDKGVRVDFYHKELQKNDLILLCSDGLTNMVDDKEIQDTLKICNGANTCCRKLVDLANTKGGKDNITVICVIL